MKSDKQKQACRSDLSKDSPEPVSTADSDPQDSDSLTRQKAVITGQSLCYVYMLSCKDGSLYTGFTTDLMHRLKMHFSGKGAKYTRSRRPVTLVYVEVMPDSRQARQREYEIKQFSRKKKMDLVLHQNLCTVKMSEVFHSDPLEKI